MELPLTSLYHVFRAMGTTAGERLPSVRRYRKQRNLVTE